MPPVARFLRYRVALNSVSALHNARGAGAVAISGARVGRGQAAFRVPPSEAADHSGGSGTDFYFSQNFVVK